MNVIYNNQVKKFGENKEMIIDEKRVLGNGQQPTSRRDGFSISV